MMGVEKIHKTSSKNTKKLNNVVHKIKKPKKVKKKLHSGFDVKNESEDIQVPAGQLLMKKKKVKSLNNVTQEHHDESERKEKGKVEKESKKKFDVKIVEDGNAKIKKLKKSSGSEKPNTLIQKPQEMTKSKKRLLDSSDDEGELPSTNSKKRDAEAAMPSLSMSLLSFTADSVSAVAQEEESSDEEEINKGEVKKRRKVSRAQKQQDAKQLEEQLREAERSRLTKDTIGPQTEDDYRELLLTNKSCSATWIQYISFLLAAGEHERARATARRGLSIIPFEEQKERINLWIVLLRLEVMHGMDDSAVETALAEACSNADDYAMLTNMADIYQENEMIVKAEEIHRRVTKKYYAELDAWVRVGQFYFSTGQLDEARTALAKALRVLKKKEGVDVTSRFAQLEHKYGNVDKAKSMFESLLANFPKRIDVWNVYVDLLIKANDTEQARNVLSRMCCLQMRLVKKMSLFSKWRQFEQTHGNARTQEAAKRTIDELLLKEEAALDE